MLLGTKTNKQTRVECQATRDKAALKLLSQSTQICLKDCGRRVRRRECKGNGRVEDGQTHPMRKGRGPSRSVQEAEKGSLKPRSMGDSRNGKGKEVGFLPESPEGTQPRRYLDFSPVGPTLDF